MSRWRNNGGWNKTHGTVEKTPRIDSFEAGDGWGTLFGYADGGIPLVLDCFHNTGYALDGKWENLEVLYRVPLFPPDMMNYTIIAQRYQLAKQPILRNDICLYLSLRNIDGCDIIMVKVEKVLQICSIPPRKEKSYGCIESATESTE